MSQKARFGALFVVSERDARPNCAAGLKAPQGSPLLYMLITVDERIPTVTLQ